MSSWALFSLDQLGAVERGRSRHRPRNDPALYGGEYPFFQTGDVKATEFHLRKYTQTYNDVGLAQSRLWEAGTLCITIAANIAESAVLAIPGCFPDSVVGFVPTPGLADVRYVKYLLDQTKLEMQAISRGTTQDNLSLDKLLSFKLPVPSFRVQCKIAAVLVAYDELIENNLRRIEILEGMAQAVYREWFIEFRFPGHEGVALVDSSLGPIPEGWKVAVMSEFTKTQYGYTASTDDQPVGPKFLRGMDFNKRPWIDWSEVPFCPIENGDFEKYKVDVDDVLVIRMADPGKVAIVEKDVEAVFASYIVRVSPDQEQALPYWLYYYMASPDYQAYIAGAGTGTTRKSASAGVLTGSRLSFPPLSIQGQFVEVVKSLRTLLNNLLDQNANLRTTRDLLLPRLLSGQIDVSELDIDTEWLAS